MKAFYVLTFGAERAYSPVFLWPPNCEAPFLSLCQLPIIQEMAGLLAHTLEVQDWHKVLVCGGYRLLTSGQEAGTRKCMIFPSTEDYPHDVSFSEAPSLKATQLLQGHGI